MTGRTGRAGGEAVCGARTKELLRVTSAHDSSTLLWAMPSVGVHPAAAHANPKGLRRSRRRGRSYWSATRKLEPDPQDEISVQINWTRLQYSELFVPLFILRTVTGPCF